MEQINSNINRYPDGQITPPGPYAVRQNAQVQQPIVLPKYYDVPTNNNKSFKDSLKDNMAYDIVLKPFIEHPIAVLATWLGFCVGSDAYSKVCRGKYEESLVGKAANLGDRIQNSRIVQSKPFQGILSVFKPIKKAGNAITKRSAILRSLKDTPTKPEWQIAKAQMFNQQEEVVQDFLRITDTLCLSNEGSPKLNNLMLNSAEKDLLKSVYHVNNIAEIPEKTAVNHILLHRLGKNPAEISKIQSLGEGSTQKVKDLILKEMGLDAEKLKLIKEDTYRKYINDVKIASEKVGNRVKIGLGHFKWMGPFTKPFERSLSCDEVYNKLHSLSEGGKTGTGRFLSKAMQMVHRGFTFGGGKLGGLIFIAPILVETAANVKKADKDQKVGTAVGGFINNISWVFTFPLAFKMMHAFGGIKYAGMTKEQVKEVRRLKQEFNDKAGSGIFDRLKNFFTKEGLKPSQFKSKTEYEIAKQEVKTKVKELSKVKGQNIFTKAIRKIAGGLTIDLENLRGYHGGSGGSKLFHDLPHLFKDMGGIPLRFVAWGLLSMGLLDTLINKGSNAIFGKQYDAMKQDERKDNKKVQKEFLLNDLKERLYETQQNKQLAAAGVPVNDISQGNAFASRGRIGINPQIEQNLDKVDNYTYIPSQNSTIPQPKKEKNVDNYTYIPSSENVIKSEKANENGRKYIPSQTAANIQKTFDNSGLQSALDRAQRAENNALKILAGNFEGL